MAHRAVLVPAVLIVLHAAPAAGENWPQWRGPELTGISREQNLPTTWGPDTNVAWKVDLPSWSGATPIIWNDHVFLNVADGDELALWAVDRRTQKVLWKQPLGGGNVKLRKQNMSSPSPVTDGRSVFVVTGTGVVGAYDFNGKKLWGRNLQEEYGAFGLNWGYASSPLLHDGGLYIQVLHGMKTDDPSYVLRLDPKTGKTVWKVERPTKAQRESPDAYTTPTLLKTGNRTELVITGGDVVTGHDLATGKELWRADGLNPENNPFQRIVASPVSLGGVVLAASRERPMLAIRGGGRGDVTDSHRAWTFTNGPDVPTPATDGKYVYIVTDRGVLYCLDVESGKTVYGPERVKPGTYSASPVIGGGHVYLTNEDGVTTVVKAGPKFEIVAENSLNDQVLSSPAVSDGQIFIRTASRLYAIGQRNTSAGAAKR